MLFVDLYGIASMKNALINRAVSLFRPSRPNLERDQRKFLVVSTTGLGDTLWGTPSVKALRETYPSSYIALLTSAIGKEIFEHNRHVDEIFAVTDPVFFPLLSHYSQLKKRAFTDVILFHTSQRPVLPFVATLGALQIIGTRGLNKGLDHLLTHSIPRSNSHEIERRLKLVGQVGAYTQDPTLELFLSEEDKKQAERFLAQCQLSPYLPKIALHPGAKDLFKQWPPSLFVALGNRLVQELGCQLFITGSSFEKPLVESIASQVQGAIPVTSLPLRPFAAFLKQMQLLVSNDTGPMHVGFAVKTPTVALFAPTDPKLCGPYFAKQTRVIAKQPTCTPCLKKQCGEPFCLLQIGVQEVYDACLAFLYQKSEKREEFFAQK
jgi:ADP-heptose:LPS heptosyltransferase